MMMMMYNVRVFTIKNVSLMVLIVFCFYCTLVTYLLPLFCNQSDINLFELLFSLPSAKL